MMHLCGDPIFRMRLHLKWVNKKSSPCKSFLKAVSFEQILKLFYRLSGTSDKRENKNLKLEKRIEKIPADLDWSRKMT